MNLKPFRFWKVDILFLGLILGLSLVGASPICAQTAGFTYVTNGGSNDVSAYVINASTGALTPVPGSPFASGLLPFSVTVHPTGRFVYVANLGIGNPDVFDVSAYAVNATTGALTPVPGSPFATGIQPASVTIHPNGQFAYVANQGSNDVSAYTVNATTGALTPVPGSPFAAGGQPVSVAVSPNGKFAYVANSIADISDQSGNVSAYVVNATTGALTPVPGSPFAAGLQTFAVAIHPSSRFAYVANALSNDVSAYSIDAATGALTPIAGSPFAADFGAHSLALTPNGRFAYVANNAADNVSAYTINTTTGALTTVPGSPFATGSTPFSVAVSPQGKFAYVANQLGPGVSAYAIDPTTGALTPVPDSPFAAGRFPTSVTTTAPAKSCKHDDEKGDRDERGDDDEQREGLGQDKGEHQDHFSFKKKHGCRDSAEKDFEEHHSDKMDESEHGRF